MASIIVRCIHVVSNYLGCVITTDHLPRKSSWEALIVDRFSREDSTSVHEEEILSKIGRKHISKSLDFWLSSPSEDWDLPNNILNDVISFFE
jgi:hypothetical protein